MFHNLLYMAIIPRPPYFRGFRGWHGTQKYHDRDLEQVIEVIEQNRNL